MVQRTYYPDRELTFAEEADPGFVDPGGTHLRWGYTLADVYNLANASATANMNLTVDWDEMRCAAWASIVEHLYTTVEQPSRHDLAIEARKAIWHEVNQVRRHHGYHEKSAYNGAASGPRFVAYWTAVSGTSYEDRLVEQIAVRQVMDALDPRHADTIAMLAAHGDYRAAAAVAGLKPASFAARVRFAVAAAQALWHDDETPHRFSHYHQRRYQRRDEASLKPCGTPAAFARHRRRGEPPCDPCVDAERARNAARKPVSPPAVSSQEEKKAGEL